MVPSVRVTVYRPLGASAAPGKARGIEGLCSPLVGRDGELAALRQAIDRLRRGIGGNRVRTEIDGVATADAFSVGSFSNAGRDFIDVESIKQLEIILRKVCNNSAIPIRNHRAYLHELGLDFYFLFFR